VQAYEYLIKCPLAGHLAIKGNMMQIIKNPLDKVLNWVYNKNYENFKRR
jgi:hypothetical protein